MITEGLCTAIRSRQLIEINYTGDAAIGIRKVEPHQIGYTSTGNLALSAYFLEGASESQTGPGWRLYLIEDISYVSLLPEQFEGPRSGYKPDGGKVLHSVVCGL